MSNNADGGTGTGSDGTVPILGLDILQVADFYVKASVLHPLAVGSIAIIALFIYLRFSSNRSVAPITVFDWLINVALGSTLAGIVNGNSLVRGLLGLITLLGFQWITSYVSSHAGKTVFDKVFSAPPLVIAFRGKALEDVMKNHRISRSELNGALRKEKIFRLEEVEACIIEPTGQFTVYKRINMPKDMEPDVLNDVPGYKALVEQDEEEQRDNASTSSNGKASSEHRETGGSEEQNEVANDCA